MRHPRCSLLIVVAVLLSSPSAAHAQLYNGPVWRDTAGKVRCRLSDGGNGYLVTTGRPPSRTAAPNAGVYLPPSHMRRDIREVRRCQVAPPPNAN
jgi:hypothetical protein